MKQHIYADNAATTQLDKKALDAMLPWLSEEYGNASQPYAFSRNPKKALSEAREIIASCIGALPEEIYFTSGGTESDNWALKSPVMFSNDKKKIITSAFEHHAVLRSCESMASMGYPVTYLYPSKDGAIQPEDLKEAIGNDTKIVSIMFANNEIGSIQPIKELCQIAHQYGALFHTDAVQAVGHIKIDVHDLDIDMLSSSAHKYNGPKGIGFLYIRKGLKIHSFIDGGSQESGLRAGTENIASIVGMAVALKNNCNELSSNISHINKLQEALLEGLEREGLRFRRNGGSNTLPGLVSLSFAGSDAEMLLHRMDLLGISISTGSACDSVNTKISHVLKAINLDESLAKGTIRISLGKNNTLEDVDAICRSLKKILGE